MWQFLQRQRWIIFVFALDSRHIQVRKKIENQFDREERLSFVIRTMFIC